MRASTAFRLVAVLATTSQAARMAIQQHANRGNLTAGKLGGVPVVEGVPGTSGEYPSTNHEFGVKAFDKMCSFWQPTVRTHKLATASDCTMRCASLKFDCNSGPGDGVVDIVTAQYGLINKLEQEWQIYKSAEPINGRFLIFPVEDGKPVMPGCTKWMSSPISWCEGLKWSKGDDNAMERSLAEGAEWDITYHWLRWDNEEGLWHLEKDRHTGTRSSDEALFTGLQTSGFSGDIGATGPDGLYTIGTVGLTDECADIDKGKGMDLPLEQDKKCKFDAYMASGAGQKVNPEPGSIIKTTWETTHFATETLHRYKA